MRRESLVKLNTLSCVADLAYYYKLPYLSVLSVCLSGLKICIVYILYETQVVTCICTRKMAVHQVTANQIVQSIPFTTVMEVMFNSQTALTFLIVRLLMVEHLHRNVTVQEATVVARDHVVLVVVIILINGCLECEVKDAEIKTLRRRIQLMEVVAALLQQKMSALQQSSSNRGVLFSPMVIPPVVSQVVIPSTYATLKIANDSCVYYYRCIRQVITVLLLLLLILCLMKINIQ